MFKNKLVYSIIVSLMFIQGGEVKGEDRNKSETANVTDDAAVISPPVSKVVPSYKISTNTDLERAVVGVGVTFRRTLGVVNPGPKTIKDINCNSINCKGFAGVNFSNNGATYDFALSVTPSYEIKKTSALYDYSELLPKLKIYGGVGAGFGQDSTRETSDEGTDFELNIKAVLLAQLANSYYAVHGYTSAAAAWSLEESDEDGSSREGIKSTLGGCVTIFFKTPMRYCYKEDYFKGPQIALTRLGQDQTLTFEMGDGSEFSLQAVTTEHEKRIPFPESDEPNESESKRGSVDTYIFKYSTPIGGNPSASN